MTAPERTRWVNPSVVFERIESRQGKRGTPLDHMHPRAWKLENNSFLNILNCSPLQNMVLALTVLDMDINEISQILDRSPREVKNALAATIIQLGFKIGEKRSRFVKKVLDEATKGTQTQR